MYVLAPLIPFFGRSVSEKSRKRHSLRVDDQNVRLYTELCAQTKARSLPEMASAWATPSFGSLIADHFEGEWLLSLTYPFGHLLRPARFSALLSYFTQRSLFIALCRWVALVAAHASPSSVCRMRARAEAPAPSVMRAKQLFAKHKILIRLRVVRAASQRHPQQHFGFAVSSIQCEDKLLCAVNRRFFGAKRQLKKA